MGSVTANSSVPSTVGEITVECPQFRILVLGKTGCGKSSLINKVFGIKDALVSHKDPGKADINLEFSHKDNLHFILHDSQGFEPGEDANFNIVKRFIEERSRMPKLEDRLHAIWICTTVPVVGERIVETGVERIVAMEHARAVPIIVVFTMYDELVNSVIMESIDDDILDLDEEQMWKSGEKKANEVFESLCMTTVAKTVGKVPVTKVSTQEKYKSTIAKLVEITDETIQLHMHDGSHTQPASLAWAIAQRGNAETNIKASIDVGRKKYWSGLLSGTDFTGQKLQRCLDIIHGDIVSIWNIKDPSDYLAGDGFKARISGLVADLVANPRTSTSGDTMSISTVAALATAAVSPLSIAITCVGSAVIFAKWVSGVYQNTPDNIACIMAYIVDLTIVMHRLFTVTVDVTEEHVVSVLEGYVKSTELRQIHNDIRTFVRSSGLRHLGEDNVLKEIIRLIEKHRVESK